MSKISHLLVHQGRLMEPAQTYVDGVPTLSWPVRETIRCRVDLSRGQDVGWRPEAGRPPDRGGTLFCDPPAKFKPGWRIQIIRGPVGTFELVGPIDEAWGLDSLDHLETAIVEVPRQVA